MPPEILKWEEGVEEERETSLTSMDPQRAGRKRPVGTDPYYLNDISVKDIAGMLSINEGAVNSGSPTEEEVSGKPTKDGNRERWWHAMPKMT